MCEIWEAVRKEYKTSVFKAERKRQLERHKSISEDNITRSSGKNRSPTFLSFDTTQTT
jgi:hypothetical protein